MHADWQLVSDTSYFPDVIDCITSKTYPLVTSEAAVFVISFLFHAGRN